VGFVEEISTFKRDGFVVLPNLLSPAEIAHHRSYLKPLLAQAPPGRNNFEGERTRRVYTLLGKHPDSAQLVEHPEVGAFLKHIMRKGQLVSTHLAIDILPGETPQPWHADDEFYQIPRPRPAFGVTLIWALDDFTEQNGATEIVLGSHKTGPERPTAETVGHKVLMPAGSLLIFYSNMWHRGGANNSVNPRLAVSVQFCKPYLRQQENLILALGDRAKDLSPRIQALIGYSIHPPFTGHVDGQHPLRVLGVTPPGGDREAAKQLLEAE